MRGDREEFRIVRMEVFVKRFARHLARDQSESLESCSHPGGEAQLGISGPENGWHFLHQRIQACATFVPVELASFKIFEHRVDRISEISDLVRARYCEACRRISARTDARYVFGESSDAGEDDAFEEIESRRAKNEPGGNQ